MALNEQEQHIVDKNKRPYFGAFLQIVWSEYQDLLNKVAEEKYPLRMRLDNISKGMSKFQVSFDVCYLIILPKEEINPLKIEQEAWKLLSPLVKKYDQEFSLYLESYSPQNANQKQLMAHLNTGWHLVQKWNVISDSFGAKYGKVWGMVQESEDAVKKLIQELQQTSSTVPL